MADNVLRIEFVGDEGDPNSRADREYRRQVEEAAQEARERSRDYDRTKERTRDEEGTRESQQDTERRNTGYREAAEDREQGRAAERVLADQDLPVSESDIPESTSRALVPYDESFARTSANLAESAAATAGEEVASVAGEAAGVGEVAGAAATAGGAVGDAAAVGVGGALIAGVGAVAEAFGPVGLAAAAVTAGFVGLTVAAVEGAEELDHLFDSLTSEFESLNGTLASARAQQEQELIIKRQQVAAAVAGDQTSIISAQTAVQKELVEIRGKILLILDRVLLPVYNVVESILHKINEVYDYVAKSWIGQSLGMKPMESPTDRFEQEAVEFLTHSSRQLQKMITGREELGVHSKPRRGPGVSSRKRFAK